VTPGSLSPEEVRRLVDPVLQLSGADGVEVVTTSSNTGLTRYANSEIIQNTVQQTVRAYIRIAVGARFASASTNRLEPEHLRATAMRALESAKQSEEDPDFPGLPDPEEVGRPDAVLRLDEATAEATPEMRADAVAAILQVANDCAGAGIYETSSHSVSVQSSTGVDCFDTYSRCVVSLLAEKDGATGYREAFSNRFQDVDVEAVARAAVDKMRSSVNATETPVGTYEVVLEPCAVALLLEYLSYIGMGAKQVIDGESFLSSRGGEMVADPAISVVDDVRHPLSVGIGFDLEGVPRAKAAVIDEGRAIGPVTDLRTSRILGSHLTGHYSGSNEFGPYASNLVMSSGEESQEELISKVDDGLLITRWHYVNVLDRPTALMTGMTRDGTWRIEKGEVTTPVHNLRFTQSILGAFESSLGVGRDLEAYAPDYGSFGSQVAPSLRCGEFGFTSTTSH
jgi:PmbA protein